MKIQTLWVFLSLLAGGANAKTMINRPVTAPPMSSYECEEIVCPQPTLTGDGIGFVERYASEASRELADSKAIERARNNSETALEWACADAAINLIQTMGNPCGANCFVTGVDVISCVPTTPEPHCEVIHRSQDAHPTGATLFHSTAQCSYQAILTIQISCDANGSCYEISTGYTGEESDTDF